ncbi:MAG TPA: hypothetical protein VHV10_21540 [Ktedonobacteraceae bacterium]|jgi:hypothetical protein|nr:hypothetical protein [Ktedonobacteraceae bacterium]
MSKEEKKPEEQSLAVNTSLISGKSPEIVNLPKEKKPIQASDKTVKGGRYLVGGILVNANGDPIKE